MNKTYEEIEYELKDGRLVTLAFDAEFEAEDHGIGAYEYWGSKATDTYWVNVCTGVDDIRVEDEDGRDVFEELETNERADIRGYCRDYADEHAPDVD